MMAQRGLMHDDPVVFALKDRQSIGIGCSRRLRWSWQSDRSSFSYLKR